MKSRIIILCNSSPRLVLVLGFKVGCFSNLTEQDIRKKFLGTIWFRALSCFEVPLKITILGHDYRKRVDQLARLSDFIDNFNKWLVKISYYLTLA